MSKKVYGIGTVFILLISVTIFMLTQNTDKDKPPEKIYIVPERKTATKQPAEKIIPTKETSIDFTKPPPGKSFENGGHWHNGEWHDSAHEVRKETDDIGDMPETDMIYPMPDNPVETLREYLEKRGHWSAKWIPEFPPDDEEAAQVAYNYWVMIQHAEAGNEYYDGPALISTQQNREMLEHYQYVDTPRAYNMYKLSWSILDKPMPNPERFNIYGFDKTAFDAERQARIDNERQAELGGNR